MTTLQIRRLAGVREGHGRPAVRRTSRRDDLALWPSSTGLLVAYCAAAAVTTLAVLAGATRHPAMGLVAFAVTVLVIATRTITAVALATAVIAWLFDNGFIIGRHGTWPGTARVTDGGWRSWRASRSPASCCPARWYSGLPGPRRRRSARQ
jgi:hypothetical protein